MPVLDDVECCYHIIGSHTSRPHPCTCLCAPYLYTDTRVDGEDIFVEDAGSVLYVSAGQYAVSIRSSVHTTDICASGVLIFANIYVISQIR